MAPAGLGDGAGADGKEVGHRPSANRSRATYVALALATIAVGLLVHVRGTMLEATVRDKTGDALWAATITWWAAALAPAARPVVRGSAAYAVCVGVELSQLYHTPAVDAIRITPLGQLVLGSGFDPRDLAAYAVGVAGAVLLDVTLIGSRRVGGRRSKLRRS